MMEPAPAVTDMTIADAIVVVFMTLSGLIALFAVLIVLDVDFQNLPRRIGCVFGWHKYKRKDGSWYIIKNPKKFLKDEYRVYFKDEGNYARLARQCQCCDRYEYCVGIGLWRVR